MRRVLLAAVTAMIVTAWPAQAQLFPSNPFPTPDASSVPSGTDSAPTIADFVGGWWHHGFSLKVNADGTAEGSWRTFKNCGVGETEGCDRFEGNLILNGGRAVIVFDSFEVPAAPRNWKPIQMTSKPVVYEAVQLPIAHGRVIHTTDTRTLHLGAVDLATLPYNTGALAQDGDGIIVCRPDDPANVGRFDERTPAQQERWEHRACGA